MFTRRRQRKVPKVPRRDGLGQLIDRTRLDLVAHGTTRCPAGAWLDAGRVALVTAQGCGWDLEATEVQILERRLQTTGWTWRWEGADLVLTLPGWLQPSSGVVAVQPGLFD